MHERFKVEKIPMVYPVGIEAATQRIQEIEQRIASFDQNQTNSVDQNSSKNVFGQILNDKMQTGSKTSSASMKAIENMIASESEKVGIDPNLVKAVVKAESGFNPNAVSKVGAEGLMQLMPSTAQTLGVNTPFDPLENIDGGSRYLKSLLNKYHSVPKAVAAYNAGPGAVDTYGGVPPYQETQNYVQQVLTYQRQYESQNLE